MDSSRPIIPRLQQRQGAIGRGGNHDPGEAPLSSTSSGSSSREEVEVRRSYSLKDPDMQQ